MNNEGALTATAGVDNAARYLGSTFQTQHAPHIERERISQPFTVCPDMVQPVTNHAHTRVDDSVSVPERGGRVFSLPWDLYPA